MTQLPCGIECSVRANELEYQCLKHYINAVLYPLKGISVEAAYYLSVFLKATGLFSFLVAAPVLWIISCILLQLQKNNKICRIGSWLLIAIIPYFVFVILLSMILEKHINFFVVYCLDGVLWSIAPLAHLVIIKAGRKEHSKILVWAGWSGLVSAACTGWGAFFIISGLFISTP